MYTFQTKKGHAISFNNSVINKVANVWYPHPSPPHSAVFLC